MTDWPLEKRQRQGMKRKIRMLRDLDREMAIGSIIFPAGEPSIYYTKIKGNVQLRPRLCVGPSGPEEVTFLERCKEIGGKDVPPDASKRAARKMEEVGADPERRQRIGEEDFD